ncbi:MAG: AEC family transporter, partial [Candidatus Margulisiibacteriota bacterium]
SPAFYLPVMFMNSGNIGFPVAMLAIGYSALSFASIYNLVNVIIIFSLGIFIISPKSSRFKFLRIPFIYAAMAGLLISLFHIELPRFLSSPIDLLGQTTIPLSLFMVGYKLRSSVLRPEQIKLAFLASFLRIGLGFLLALAFIKLFNIEGVVAQVIMILSTTPAAIMNIAIAQENSVETDFLATTITISTLLSIITIPLVLWFIF